MPLNCLPDDAARDEEGLLGRPHQHQRRDERRQQPERPAEDGGQRRLQLHARLLKEVLRVGSHHLESCGDGAEKLGKQEILVEWSSDIICEISTLQPTYGYLQGDSSGR